LDEVPKLFDNTAEIKIAGVNIGHWNNSNHEFSVINKKIMIDNDKLICYHFSGFRIIDENTIITVHELSRANIPFFYQIYKEVLKRVIKMISDIDMDFNGFATAEDLIYRLESDDAL